MSLAAAVRALSAASGLQPIVESPQRRARRIGGGFNHVVRIDAERFKRAFEKAQGESLLWKPARFQRLLALPVFDAYPEVYVDPNGRPQVADGRHRISVAAHRDLDIEVAVWSTADAQKLKDAIEHYS